MCINISCNCLSSLCVLSSTLIRECIELQCSYVIKNILFLLPYLLLKILNSLSFSFFFAKIYNIWGNDVNYLLRWAAWSNLYEEECGLWLKISCTHFNKKWINITVLFFCVMRCLFFWSVGVCIKKCHMAQLACLLFVHGVSWHVLVFYLRESRVVP